MISNELSNIEIDKVLKKKNIKYNGIFMRDELTKQQFINNGFYIINLDKSSGEGTHWTLIYKSNNKSYYYDSYGFPAPEEIEDIIKPYIYNVNQIQGLESTSCGYFIIGFILYFNNNKKRDDLEIINDYINLFTSDFKDNEYILYKLLKKYNIVV